MNLIGLSPCNNVRMCRGPGGHVYSHVGWSLKLVRSTMVRTGRLNVRVIIRELLTTLQLCHFSLERSLLILASDHLQSQMMDNNDSTSRKDAPFRFYDLPWELRSQILENIDLVCDPDRYHADNLEVGFDAARRAFYLTRYNPDCKNTYSPSGWSTGSTRYVWAAPNQRPYCCPMNCWGQPRGESKPPCSCFKFPGALFTVSKQMYEDAYEPFLSKNRLIILGSLHDKLLFLNVYVPKHESSSAIST